MWKSASGSKSTATCRRSSDFDPRFALKKSPSAASRRACTMLERSRRIAGRGRKIGHPLNFYRRRLQRGGTRSLVPVCNLRPGGGHRRIIFHRPAEICGGARGLGGTVWRRSTRIFSWPPWPRRNERSSTRLVMGGRHRRGRRGRWWVISGVEFSLAG